VLCAVLSELPEARGVGLDISSDACVVAQNNIDRLGFSARATVQRTDIAKFEDSGFDVVLSNPPYVRSSEIASLDPEVRIYDPQTALDGGPDGLSFYRLIISKYYQWAAKSFLCAVEIGHDQGQAVKEMLSVIGVRGTIKKDLAGRDRIVFWES
jgi:release factor glutamine methyltransferase